MSCESAIEIVWREVSRPMLHLFDLTQNFCLNMFERWNRLEHVENIAIWCLGASKAHCHQHFGVAQRATMSTHKLAERPITLVLATSMAEFFHHLPRTLPHCVMKACNSEACNFA